jgi:formate dehydrogenase major subunit
MNAPAEAALELQLTEFTLNGRTLAATDGETIIQVAQRNGIEIPHLCYKPGMRADGNCRACMVEIKGERVLAPSCCRAPTAGMEVRSDSPRAVHAQKLIVEMLAADVPARVYCPIGPGQGKRGWASASHGCSPRRRRICRIAMAVNLNVHSVHARVRVAKSRSTTSSATRFAGPSQIVFDLGDPMGESDARRRMRAGVRPALAPAHDAYLSRPIRPASVPTVVGMPTHVSVK